ncbi:MAG: hypothetical protein QW303_07045 [Nitrososphaerota archaeon]
MLVIVDGKLVRGEYLKEGVPEVYRLGKYLYGVYHENKQYIESKDLREVDGRLDFSQFPKVQYIGSISRESAIEYYYQFNDDYRYIKCIKIYQGKLGMSNIESYIEDRLIICTTNHLRQLNSYVYVYSGYGVIPRWCKLIDTKTYQIYELNQRPDTSLIEEAIESGKVVQLVKLVKLYSEHKISSLGRYDLEKALFSGKISLKTLLNEFDKPSVKESIFAGVATSQLNLKNAANMIDKVQVDNQLANIGINVCVSGDQVLVRHMDGDKLKHIVYKFDKKGHKGEICPDNRINETYIVDFCNKYSLCMELDESELKEWAVLLKSIGYKPS